MLCSCLRFQSFSNLLLAKRTAILQHDHRLVSPHDIFESVVQVRLCLLHFLLLGISDHLAVLAMERPPEQCPCSDDGLRGSCLTSSMQDLYQLTSCCFVVVLHTLLYDGKHFGSQSEASATAWKTRNCSVHLVSFDCCPHRLFGDLKSFCCQTLFAQDKAVQSAACST